MTAALPVAPVSAAPRAPAAHSAPSAATPAPRELFFRFLEHSVFELGFLVLLLDSVHDCEVLLLDSHLRLRFFFLVFNRAPDLEFLSSYFVTRFEIFLRHALNSM
jgi:hypothetical protein